MTRSVRSSAVLPAQPAHYSSTVALPGRRKATNAMILGIVGAALGFLVVPLALAVAATTLASLAFQEMDSSGIPRAPGNGRSMAIAGLVLGVVALCVWPPILLVVAIVQS